MRQKFTGEDINSKINNRGISLIGEYLGASVKTKFQCLQGHSWLSSPNNVIRGSNCPVCAKQLPHTIESINQRLESRKIVIQGEYKNANTNAKFACNFGHIWYNKPGNVLHGQGCPYCSKRAPLSKSIVNNILSPRNIEMVSEYKNVADKAEFKCFCGNTWNAKLNNVLRGQGHASCSKYGFNPSRPGFAYILMFDSYIKFGITNKLEQRFKQHKKQNGNFVIVKYKLFESGEDALKWEKIIKKTYGGSYVTKEICKHGFTETLSPELLNNLLITLD